MAQLDVPRDPAELSLTLAQCELCGHTIHVFEMGETRWLLDLRRHRFLRVTRDTPLDFQVLLAPWRSYHQLTTAADGSLTIVVDADARRIVHARAS